MENEITQADALAGVYRSAPGKAWRVYRLALVSAFSGDAAQEACPDHRPWHSTARHEIGHALAGFLVRGRSGSVALCSWGGLAGGFDSQADAEVKGFEKTDAEYRAPYETALELAGVADRAARVRAALVRLFGKLWHRASIYELGHELFMREYIDETELEAYFETMFPNSPARVRALAADTELAAAACVAAEGRGGTGDGEGVLRRPGSGEARPGARTEGARQVPSRRDEQAAAGPE